MESGWMCTEAAAAHQLLNISTASIVARPRGVTGLGAAYSRTGTLTALADSTIRRAKRLRTVRPSIGADDRAFDARMDKCHRASELRSASDFAKLRKPRRVHAAHFKKGKAGCFSRHSVELDQNIYKRPVRPGATRS
ncbi:hypothetical protein MJO28_016008 [Puccinia striiformis f. sp. tritici]|uniref:Uncharacterized protein n=3 Tax=Puccinia striiformis TaxID=27350 RepID=A0A0L0VCU7_9BASI|nr:hypothetical protein MJO29_015388 [Puccinia striiformis f. sp. tritici]KAI7937109.1 hypothetical protein MJO28_016008 [Puccinia striiformis f. sp. tritici]KNE97095.1 hypothetical protein PSTG_09669 [Puccinia striiformis f. sp. tritici PST-78]POW08369.1 hypothetical protein PSTT_07632 [Puccinia striiformis]